MFSTTSRSTRRVRIISAALAAGAMIAAFGMTAGTASAVFIGGPPVNVAAPVITGTAVVNNTVTMSTGVWAQNGPTTYTFNWSDADSGSLSTEQSYQIQSSDIGQTLTATVTAHNTTGGQTDSSTVMGSAVVDTEVSNTVEPVLSGSVTPNGVLSVTTGTWAGSGGYTYSYDWGYSTGQSGGQLTPPDATNTHLITADDFGVYLVVLVTATDSNGQQATVRETTATVVTPAAPFATDAGFNASNEGVITDTQTKTQATITDPTGAEGDTVFVYGYSTPKPLGFFVLDANKQITVPFTGLVTGNHTLALIDANGVLVGWVSVAAGATLASTGVNVNAPLELGAAGLLILLGILSVVFATRQRRAAEAL